MKPCSMAKVVAQRVLISALASNQIGTGHLRRMATLMQALTEAAAQSGPIELICHTTALGQAILADIAEVQIHQLLLAPDDPQAARQQLSALMPELRPDITILDNYIWDRDSEAALRPACGFLCVIDDLTDRPHDADLLLNQNANISDADYDGLVRPGCHLLTGPAYCLVARPFRLLRAAGLPDPQERLALEPIFLSLGGGDPNRDILRLLSVVLEVTDRQIRVATGSHIPDAEALLALSQRSPRVLLHLDSTVVAQQMAASSYAVAASGTMIWERSVLGLPSLSLIAADNQVPTAEWLEARGYLSVFDVRPGWTDAAFATTLAAYEADTAARVAQSATARALIRGDGALRAALAILTGGAGPTTDPDTLIRRPAT